MVHHASSTPPPLSRAQPVSASQTAPANNDGAQQHEMDKYLGVFKVQPFMTLGSSWSESASHTIEAEASSTVTRSARYEPEARRGETLQPQSMLPISADAGAQTNIRVPPSSFAPFNPTPQIPQPMQNVMLQNMPYPINQITDFPGHNFGAYQPDNANAHADAQTTHNTTDKDMELELRVKYLHEQNQRMWSIICMLFGREHNQPPPSL